MTYRDRVKPLADLSEQKVQQLVAALVAGRITPKEFAQLAAVTVSTYNQRAAMEADIALAVTLTQLGRRVAPLGVVPDDEDRLQAAWATSLAKHGLGALAGHAKVLARAEPLAAAQDTYSEAMRTHGVGAWTRQTDANACKVCRDLTGPILPASVSMFHHPGCSCTQRVIVDA